MNSFFARSNINIKEDATGRMHISNNDIKDLSQYLLDCMPGQLLQCIITINYIVGFRVLVQIFLEIFFTCEQVPARPPGYAIVPQAFR